LAMADACRMGLAREQLGVAGRVAFMMAPSRMRPSLQTARPGAAQHLRCAALSCWRRCNRTPRSHGLGRPAEYIDQTCGIWWIRPTPNPSCKASCSDEKTRRRPGASRQPRRGRSARSNNTMIGAKNRSHPGGLRQAVDHPLRLVPVYGSAARWHHRHHALAARRACASFDSFRSSF